MIPAVEYVQANRLRWQVMDKMAELMSDIDLYVAPSFDSLLLTNLTGHPCVVLPNGFEKTNSSDVVPTSISFIGQLYGEAKLMTAAKAYQDITGFHLNYPQP
jgi:Asp-tRNA(Asn)/Glu-tRNA(Gln) amidotransferase A subunit family amidase